MMKRLQGFIVGAFFLSWFSYGAYNYLANRGVPNIKLASNTETVGARNLGIKASVSGNALTVSAVQADGATNGSATFPIDIWFRNATATTGAPALVSVTGALSITVPTLATLGHTSAVNQYVWVYALNDGGTIDICVSGVQVFFNTDLNASTAISSSATSGTTLYCASSHSGSKPTTIIGRLLVNEATAGTWASAPTQIDVLPVPRANISFYPVNAGTFTIGGSTTAGTYGTVVTNTEYYDRVGSKIHVIWAFNQSAGCSGGTCQGSGAYLYPILPATGCTGADTTVHIPFSGTANVGATNTVGHGNASSGTNVVTGEVILHDSTHVKLLGENIAGSAVAYVGSSTIPLSAQAQYNLEAWLTCSGWSLYGP